VWQLPRDPLLSKPGAFVDAEAAVKLGLFRTREDFLSAYHADYWVSIDGARESTLSERLTCTPNAFANAKETDMTFE
jgi:hypothetical protein